MAIKLTSVLRGICLAGAMATSGLWARSHGVSDEYNWAVGPGHGLIHSRAIFTTPGRIVFNELSAFT
jgi:hypothetical protein